MEIFYFVENNNLTHCEAAFNIVKFVKSNITNILHSGDTYNILNQYEDLIGDSIVQN